MKSKVILLLTAFVTVFTSCKDDDESKFKGNLSPVYIYGMDKTNKAEGVEATAETVHEILTNHECIHLGADIEGGNLGLAFMEDYGKSRGWELLNGIDTENDRLIMNAGNIIENERIDQYGGIFLTGRNFILTDDDTQDTLGYIPNSVIREAQKDILDMWKAGDISAIYERFQQAFYFIPCTGEEFKSLKEDIDWEHEYDDLKAEHEHTHEIRW